MPLFWRFHRVHHSDLNLDVSSALRFHLGELSISAVIKISLIYFLGADIRGVVVFEILVVLTSQFQHSNIRCRFGSKTLAGFVRTAAASTTR
jgi:sterol desaturase/sphingolipid hydroxylase (fatty acid hydroxylase superfamily)